MGLRSLINGRGLTPLAANPVDTSRGGVISRDTFAPNFEIIHRGGRGAHPVVWNESITQYIDEIVYEDNADQFDRLTITFVNQMDKLGGSGFLSLIDNKLLSEGSILEIQMGYGNVLRTVGAAELVKKQPAFEDSPSLTIEGYDLLHRAARRKPKTGIGFKGFRDSQIASIIGSRHGFDISNEDARSIANIKQTGLPLDTRAGQKKGQSDYDYLKKLADYNGYDLFSKFDPGTGKFVLFFQPGFVENSKEVFTFVYGEGEVPYSKVLMSFNPSLDAYDQGTDFEIYEIENKSKTKVEVISRLTIDEQKKFKEETERRFTGANFGNQGGKQPANSDGIEVSFKAFGRSFRFPRYKRFRSEFQARKEIEEFVKRQKENFITGSGRVEGNEAMQSRQVHNFEGITDQYSGKYYLNQVRHIMKKSEGYTVEFQSRKVIDDFIVQSPPALNLSANDVLLKRLKGE